MEILVPAIILVLAVLYARRISEARDKPRDAPPTEELPPFPRPAAQPAPFDTTTARPLADRPVLTGSAWVVDGDTIKIRDTQIRLFGIDAPELNHPYGKSAKWALHKLCKGETVRAELVERDDYGRTVARCYLSDGRDLSAEMVRQGLALDWAKFSGGQYRTLETEGARKKLYLADARQKGRMDVWERFEARQTQR